MRPHQRAGCWYIDVRPGDSTEQISFDITQHLPRRVAAGKSLVVCDDPRRLLPVIRKRWVALQNMIEKQRASTLNHTTRFGLQREARHLQTHRFTRGLPSVNTEATVYFLTPDDLDKPLIDFKTIYIVSHLSQQDFALAVSHLLEGGLVMLYGDWNADYEAVMNDLVRSYREGGLLDSRRYL